MDGQQESKAETDQEAPPKVDLNATVEEQSGSVPAKTSNAEDENDVTPPSTGKVTKKKSKSKARSTATGINLDSELKKLTQRRINVAGAPKMPLNSYVRFMNDRREELRREYPNRTALEHTKMIGEEWHQLTDDRKAPYLEAAAKDKALYQEQMHKFLKEHPEIVATELAKAKKVFESKNASTPRDKAASNICSTDTSNANTGSKKAVVKSVVSKQPIATPDPDDIPLSQVKRTPTPPPSHVTSVAIRPGAPGEIPIYTNEFIEHNRSTENELRTLRKTKTDLEQQNAVLEQHVDNTKAGHAKVMAEVSELKEENARLAAYVKQLRQRIVNSLSGVALPSIHPSGLNVDNVDKYIKHLADMVSNTSADVQQNNAVLMEVADRLCKMDTSSLQKS